MAIFLSWVWTEDYRAVKDINRANLESTGEFVRFRASTPKMKR